MTDKRFSDSLIRAVTAKLRTKRMRVHDLSGVNWEPDDDCAVAARLIDQLYAAWIAADEDATVQKEFLAAMDAESNRQPIDARR